jgi:hypothetical protein
MLPSFPAESCHLFQSYAATQCGGILPRQSFLPLIHGGKVSVDSVRPRFLVDGYSLNRAQCKQLPQMIADHTEAMHQLVEDGARAGTQPWARLHAEGHAKHWGHAAEYVELDLKEWILVLT